MVPTDVEYLYQTQIIIFAEFGGFISPMVFFFVGGLLIFLGDGMGGDGTTGNYVLV